jgi:sulfite exporter TauE/SafE
MSLIAILIASLIGSPHCAGMCGGFVSFYSAQKNSLIDHIQYNCGRLAAYISLGIVASYLGATINKLGGILGLQSFAGLLIGCLLIYWGISKLFSFNAWGKLPQLILRILNKLHIISIKNNRIPLIIGLFSAFLPCAWLYAYVALAAASDSTSQAIVTMFVFWLGTVPMMFGLGSLSGIFYSRFSRILPKISAIFIIIAGVYSIYSHFNSKHSNHCHQHQTHTATVL